MITELEEEKILLKEFLQALGNARYDDLIQLIMSIRLSASAEDRKSHVHEWLSGLSITELPCHGISRCQEKHEESALQKAVSKLQACGKLPDDT